MRATITFGLTLLLLAAPATAKSSLTKAETSALKTAERQLLSLAKYAARGKDLTSATKELELGLAIVPDSKRLKREVTKVEKKVKKAKKRAKKKRYKATTVKASFRSKLSEKTQKAHEKVALSLADAALATEKEFPKRYMHYVGLIQTYLPIKAALDRLDLVYFKPYQSWVSKTEAATLSAGGERFEGKLLNASAVEALNRQHATFSNPWILSDEVHEIRTTVPLRQARRILAYVGAYRRYFLKRFGDVWKLKTPKGKLPVIVTRTQAELQQQMTKFTGGSGALGSQGIQGAAFYMQSTGTLNPCFVTMEPKDATGRTFTIKNFTELQIPLAHEVTHQIAFEYSKFDANATRQIQHQFWSVEAIANYMGYHSYDGTKWTLTHPRTIPMGQGMIEGPFAHCVHNVNSLTPIKQLMGFNQQQFVTVNNYHLAATLAYFLLEGEGKKYRKQFVKLLQTVHRVKDTANTFEKSFPGVSQDKMQAEFLRFVKKIKLDS